MNNEDREALKTPVHVLCERNHKRNLVIAETCPACEFGKPRKLEIHRKNTLDKAAVN